MDVAYPIISVGMGALRWATGIVRLVDSAAVHVSSALISPVIGLLPKHEYPSTIEDDPEPKPSSTSLYDEMDSMLNGKWLPLRAHPVCKRSRPNNLYLSFYLLILNSASALVYTYVNLRNSAKKSKKKFQEKYKCTDIEMSALENAWNLVKRIKQEIKEAEQSDLNRLKVSYYDELQNFKGLLYKKSTGITESEIVDLEKQFDLLSLPKDAAEIRNDFKNNIDQVKTYVELFGGQEFNSQAIQKLVDSCTEGDLLFVDDDFSMTTFFGAKTELTWAITINHSMKRITVVFRGSTVLKDFVIDATLQPTEFLVDGPESVAPPLGKVHSGFYAYLYNKTQVGSDGRDISKSEAIMGRLHELFGTYKDYKLYVTGHSLGAALSTLFAFRAADNNGIPNKPVMNVSFASPFVGDQKFRNEFQKREVSGFIRHLRVSNEDDIVPLVPFSSLPLPLPMAYKHVGLNVTLYNPVWWRNKNHDISFPKPDDLWDEVGRAIKHNVFLGLEPLTLFNHLCPEYRSRLDRAANQLRKLNLEALYRNPNYTGQVAYGIRTQKHNASSLR